ncbi:group 3 secretory phospholipase A2-like isoform X1 [Sebastes umbrosus]|uniref:group 3 secretory phospholipase A2-like isoform X1 n=1 Tax=Sebastes umbrosus TaxID=72105 RepID=UPI00189FD791|nr:group 3 secretory phospholipase A2-like isoform X1 [Sebastes umbrosus]
MQSRCLLQVVFAISSLFLSKTQCDVMGSGGHSSCLRSSRADDGQTRVTFLREDAAGVRWLFLSLWSEDTRPLTCEVNTDPLVTETYRSLCDRRGAQGQEITQKRFNISALLAPDAPCGALVSSSAQRRTRRDDGTERKTRRKRAWIFPGTLWCGTGSKAAEYDQLGMFESADRCCREHDHCLHIIQALTVNYGVFNPNFFTVSHCDCDQRFRQCLLGVNDTISSMVGYSFFNILRVPCFELEQRRRCTQMYWWGTCRVTKKAPYAVFKKPLPYADVTSKYGDNTDSKESTSSEGQHVNESFVINPHRESPKSERKCSSRDPPRGDTFYPRRKKGKGCKRHRKLYTAAPSQIPPMSRALTTTPSMKMGLLNASKSSTLMPNKKRAGKKKSTRKGLLAYTTQGSQVQPQETSKSTSTTQSTPTATTTVTKTTESRKKGPTQSRCCGFRTPLRGDTFQPRCKSCLEEKATPRVTTVTPSTTTYGLAIKVTTAGTLRLKKTTETPKQDTLKRLWSTTATPVTTKLMSAASIHEDDKPQKQMYSPLLQNNTSQEPMGGTTAQSTHAERGLKQNIALHNMTDNQLLCGSLKHLDECKYKIHPLEKKYDLQNMDSKTAYHCDCTSRLAVQIESFKRPSILPKLLMDFVSQYCFKLPKEKKCRRRKSCSGGFTKASDLLQALKMIEEKDTAGVRNSGNDRRRGIPTRLYKRCLRLEKRS